MESLSVLEMILEYYKEDHVKSYWIIQYPRASYKIVQDAIAWGWDLEDENLGQKLGKNYYFSPWKDLGKIC